MATNKEIENVTGLDQATNRKEAERDLLSSLFAAANFKTDSDNIQEIRIERNGVYFFTLHLHPISDADITFANKKATQYKDHPQGKKYGKIEVGYDKSTFKSWVIYLATTEEDQQKIWGNREFMSRFNLQQPWQSIDQMLTVGDKSKLMDVITDISGLDDDEDEEKMDPETFQS